MGREAVIVTAVERVKRCPVAVAMVCGMPQRLAAGAECRAEHN